MDVIFSNFFHELGKYPNPFYSIEHGAATGAEPAPGEGARPRVLAPPESSEPSVGVANCRAADPAGAERKITDKRRRRPHFFFFLFWSGQLGCIAEA
ncbi:Hypothetical predicted protein [Olea europaea subsp. europaea]|uniref:Uncharacterized protein n=1 Tax=Olea europaea subsp. europaea TaxID=158383 RepID=A0A8S0P691_OLEEU|nr:Hypothetical predicted protein [Olea europaea subsp. europaea]